MRKIKPVLLDIKQIKISKFVVGGGSREKFKKRKRKGKDEETKVVPWWKLF